MVAAITLYLDDSGTRHPDHKPQLGKHNHDWFSLGGVLINDEDEDGARKQIDDFRSGWPQLQGAPFHSVDIRHQTEKFRWLKGLSKDERDRFFSELDQLVAKLPVVGIACVIDRPGYNERYREKFGRERWSLCRTAFNVLLERSAKYALERGRVLRVMPEKCSKKDDNVLKGYYNDLKTLGHPFDTERAQKYSPLTPEELKPTLYEFKLKDKTSPMAQMADLFLWPMSIGGYDSKNRTYDWLMQNGRLIDCYCGEQSAAKGVKYSCFELVTRK